MPRTFLARSVVWILAAFLPACASTQNASAKPSVGGDSTNVQSRPSARALTGRKRGYTGFDFNVTATMGPDHRVTPSYPVVRTVQPGSPAEKSGLAPEDVILEVNGKDVAREPGALFAEPGVKYLFRIRRGGEEREIILVPLPRPPDR
jgi:S1-C subfamily serine protease